MCMQIAVRRSSFQGDDLHHSPGPRMGPWAQEPPGSRIFSFCFGSNVPQPQDMGVLVNSFRGTDVFFWENR